MTIFGLNMDGLGANTRAENTARALTGALYGFVGGMMFVLVAAFIDIWLNPDLPLVLNRDRLLVQFPLITLGLALVGAVTCWWHEAWQGLIGGAVTAAVMALIVALFSSEVGAGMKFIVLVFILLPIAAMAVPLAYLLRWLMEHHARAWRLKWRAVRVASLFLLLMAVGAGLGYFMKSSGRAIEATRFIHGHLQDLSTEKNPLAVVQGFPERNSMPYTLFTTKSEFSTEGFDIHVEFEDGYKANCSVVLYPERQPFFTGCRHVE
jgi:MFS family permease